MAKKSYTAIIEVTIAGIPCQAGVIYFDHTDGSYSYNANSDYDYYGYSEIDWELLDRKGYVAGTWLTDKMTRRDAEEIEEKIFKEMTR